jgi:hypothetical protein
MPTVTSKNREEFMHREMEKRGLLRSHNEAQKNAALSIEEGGLGLSPNNTAEERAKALGFTLPMFHGTDIDFQKFSPEGRGKTANSGIYVTDNPAVASTYAHTRGGRVMPVLINPGNVVSLEANNQNWRYLNKKNKITVPSIVTKNGDSFIKKKGFTKSLGNLFPDDLEDDDTFSVDDIARWAKKNGYDSMEVNNIIDRGPIGAFHTEKASNPSKNHVVFNPKNIRSRFAAFDPMKRESEDLLD